MEEVRRAAAEAIRRIAAEVRWKPGKDVVHLEKRRAMGHLPPEATLRDYEAVIRTVLGTPDGRVFIFRVGGAAYVGIRADVGGRPWLVIFGLDGIMETAFPPRDIERYLTRQGFAEIGTIEEVVG